MLEQQIKIHLTKILSLNEGTDDDASLFESGDLDSLAMVELIEELEKRFSITVTPSEINPTNFDSIAKLTHFVQKKLASC